MTCLITSSQNYQTALTASTHISIATLAQKWLAYIDTSSEQTLSSYSRCIAQFLKYLQNSKISQPTRQDILNFKAQLSETKKPSTVNSYLVAIRLLFAFAEDMNLYSNIARNIKAVKVDKTFKKDYLTKEQSKELLSSVDTSTLKGKRDFAMLLLMLTTGLRTIEVMRADVADIQLKAGSRVLYIQGKGKTDKTDYVKLSSATERALRSYLTARKAEASEPLFTSDANRNTGERMTTRSISRIAKTHLRSIDLDSSRLTAHSLRHTTATLNLLAGATLADTQLLLRHSSSSTTQLYSHALERDSLNSEQRISDFLEL